MSHPPAPADTPALFLWRQALRTGRRSLLTSMGTAVLASASGVGAALGLGQALAILIAETADPSRLALPAGVYLMGAVLRAGLAATSEIAGARASAATRTNLRHQLVRAIIAKGPVGISDTTSGTLATLLMDKVEACDAYVARYLPQLATALLVPPAVLVIVALYSPVPAVLLAGTGLCLPLLLAFFGILTARASRTQMLALTRMGAQFADRLRNLPLLRTFSASRRELDGLARTADDFRSRTMAVLRLAFLSASAMDIVQTCALAGLALYMYHHGTALPAALTILLLALEFFTPLRALSASYHDRAAGLSAATDILPWLTPASTPHEDGHRPLPAPLTKPSLELLKVSFTYPGRTDVALHDFSLRVEGGEFLALTGPSGGGKSTILHLLLGFIRPDRGMLVLAQQPLHLIDPVQRGSVFAYVGQRTQLFHGTLADNIRLGQPQADEAAVLAAARAARLDPLLADLPDGLQTLIGERGYGLSGGQAQRVALARAFLREAPVLLLDEPTAGLDADTAAGLLETIRVMARTRTVIMATHDPQALQAADRIVRVGGGS